jgi:hypothetical protein
MKINLTILEGLPFALCFTLTALWAKYGKKNECWWKDWRKRRRGPQHSTHGNRAAARRAPKAIIVYLA